MINVAIVGSTSAIIRHTHALGKLQDIRITDRWISSGSQEYATNPHTDSTCTNPDLILENADVFILTDPGLFNNRLAFAALRKARHIFLHPFVVQSVDEAYQLIKLSREANVIAKCGRIGNTSMLGLRRTLPDRDVISMVELQHYRKIDETGNPGNVFAALLSDMEIINDLVHARIISLKAKGLCMLSSEPEIINARLEFDNGCAVNFNSNLVAAQNECYMTLVVKNRILKYNFLTHQFTGWHLNRTSNQNESPIFIESILVEQSDPLLDDLSDFFSLIHSGPAFLSMNDSGFESYVLTDRILEKVMKTLVQCT